MTLHQKRHLQALITAFPKSLAFVVTQLIILHYSRSIGKFGHYFYFYSIIKVLFVFLMFGTNRLIIRELPFALKQSKLVDINAIVSLSFTIIIITNCIGLAAIVTLNHFYALLPSTKITTTSLFLLLMCLTCLIRAINKSLGSIIKVTLVFDFILEYSCIGCALLLAINSLILEHAASIFILMLTLFMIYSIVKLKGLCQITRFKFNPQRIIITFHFFIYSLQKMLASYLYIFIINFIGNHNAAGAYSILYLLLRFSKITIRASTIACNFLLSRRKDNISGALTILKYSFRFRFVYCSLLFMLGLGIVLYHHAAQLLASFSYFILTLSIVWLDILLQCKNSVYMSYFNMLHNPQRSNTSLLFKWIAMLFFYLPITHYCGYIAGFMLSFFSNMIFFMSNVTLLVKYKKSDTDLLIL